MTTHKLYILIKKFYLSFAFCNCGKKCKWIFCFRNSGWVEQHFSSEVKGTPPEWILLLYFITKSKKVVSLDNMNSKPMRLFTKKSIECQYKLLFWVWYQSGMTSITFFIILTWHFFIHCVAHRGVYLGSIHIWRQILR